MSAPTIGEIGEKAVQYDLEQKGFKTKRKTTGPGSTDIEAKKGSDYRLIQVKTGKHPNIPGDLSSQEIRNIKSRAARIGATAYEAKVWLNHRNDVKDIKYRSL